MSINEEMKASVYKDINKTETKIIPKPKLESEGAIIKVLGCGLCGSDLVKLTQGLVKEGTVLGHEVVGIIEEIKGVSDFNVGDRVVLGHHVPCFNCVYCKNENYSMCKKFKETNIFPGGFCEYIYASIGHLQNTTHKVPEHLTDEEASFTEPVACCLRAVNRAKINKNDKVLVIGLGSIGLLMGQVLKSFGAEVIGCDLLEERLTLAKELGFDKTYKYINDHENSLLIKQNHSQEGVDKVFLTAGASSSINLSYKAVRDGGTILVFASVPDQIAGFANNEIYYRELTVLGSYSPSCQDLKESLELISQKKVLVKNLSTKYSLDSISQAVDDILSNKITKAYISI